MFLSAGTKEAAFTSAIWAAGVAHSVTRACSMGNLTSMCGCDRSKEGQQDPDGWTWGCSADIEYGINRSRTFFDAQESGKGGLVLMDKHNTEAGHKVGLSSSQTHRNFFTKKKLGHQSTPNVRDN